MHESQTVLDSEERSFLALDDILLRMKAVTLLTKEEYNIVSLHYWLDIPITSLELGATSLTKLTGLSERTIRTRLQEAKEKLKTIMKEEPPHASDTPKHNGP